MKTRALLPLVTACLCLLALPPFGWSWLSWCAFAPLFVVSLRRSPGRAFGHGYLCGLIVFAGLIYGVIPLSLWVFVAGSLALPFFFATVLALLAWYGVAAGRRRWLWTLLAPALWTSLEYASVRLLVPINAGIMLQDQPLFLQICDTTGIYGASFLVVLVNALLAQLADWLVQGRGRESFAALWTPVALTIAAMVSAMSYGAVALGRSATGEGKKARVAVLQGNVPYEAYLEGRFQPRIARSIEARHLELLRRAAAAHPDLIVWPEGASGQIDFRIPRLRREIRESARAGHSWLALGSSDVDSQGREFNSVFVVAPGGRLAGRFDKKLLVPAFEEQYTVGTTNDPVATPAGALSALVCFESAFPGPARTLVRHGAQMLVTVTDDSAMRASALPLLHAATVVLRAVEVRRPVLFASNRGPSRIVNASGQVVAEARLLDEAVLHGEVRPRNDRSRYLRWGDWFAVLCLAVTVAFLALTGVRRIRNRRLSVMANGS